jgi:hypothetical protein
MKAWTNNRIAWTACALVAAVVLVGVGVMLLYGIGFQAGPYRIIGHRSAFFRVGAFPMRMPVSTPRMQTGWMKVGSVLSLGLVEVDIFNDPLMSGGVGGGAYESRV